MKLSITIVNYNQKFFPKFCLESLEKTQNNFEYEIIFCDNGSLDESIGFLREMAKKERIHLVEPKKNLGYGAGHNMAIKQAKGEYVLILNTDITVETDTLQKLVDYLDKNKNVGMIGLKLKYHNGNVQHSCRSDFKFFDLFIKRTFLKRLPFFKKRYLKYVMADFDHNCVQQVDLITGAFMMIPKKVFEEVHGFDERFFLFMEDFDLCKKIRKAGYNIVYYPLATATHYHKRLSEGGVFQLLFKKISWLHLASAIKYHWKWR